MTPIVRLYGAHHAAPLPFSVRELHDMASSLLGKAFDGKESPLFEMELILTRDGGSRTANEDRLGCCGPTNILSFPAGPPGPSLRRSGQDIASIILNVDAIRRESLFYGQSISERLLCLLSHGIGHLMGYEHGAEMSHFCNNLLK